MRLQKALKLRKRLVGEIADLKREIAASNSFMEGSLNPEKYNVPALYQALKDKVDKLVSLKFAINEANREIQSKIYVLSEYKALIDFWKIVETKEGEHPISVRFGESAATKQYKAQVTAEQRKEYIEEYQKRIDALQEEIDTYNYTTDIPWGDEEVPPQE